MPKRFAIFAADPHHAEVVAAEVSAEHPGATVETAIVGSLMPGEVLTVDLDHAEREAGLGTTAAVAEALDREMLERKRAVITQSLVSMDLSARAEVRSLTHDR